MSKHYRKKKHKHHHPYHEEYGAEMAPTNIPYRNSSPKRATKTGDTVGYIAIAAAVLSLFTSPILFGVLAIALGAYSYSKGAKSLGIISLIVGGIAVAMSFFYRIALLNLFMSMF